MSEAEKLDAAIEELSRTNDELLKMKLRVMAVKQYLRKTQENGEHPTAVAVRAILDGEDDA